MYEADSWSNQSLNSLTSIFKIEVVDTNLALNKMLGQDGFTDELSQTFT